MDHLSNGASSASQTKVCPQCGQVLFADMTVCYGCLHDFSREGGPVVGQAFAGEETHAPEAPMASARREPPASLRHADTEPPTSVVYEELEELPADVTVIRDAPLVPISFALLIESGDVDVEVPLPPGGLSIGRLPSNDVVLHSKSVSRRHARVTPMATGALVEDQGAMNPVLYQGREAPPRLEIAVGETVDVCGTLLTLVELPASRLAP